MEFLTKPVSNESLLSAIRNAIERSRVKLDSETEIRALRARFAALTERERQVMRELVSLRAWLLAEGCTHVAMESTGVYWRPIYAILEGALEIVVANAQHVNKVPGRKTDVKDAEWLADLLCHGLLRLVPAQPSVGAELIRALVQAGVEGVPSG